MDRLRAAMAAHAAQAGKSPDDGEAQAMVRREEAALELERLEWERLSLAEAQSASRSTSSPCWRRFAGA